VRISEMVGQVAAWHLVTFPEASAKDIAEKMLEEVLELQSAHGDAEVAEELADVVLCAFALAGRGGLDLESALASKFEVNKARAHAGRWA